MFLASTALTGNTPLPNVLVATAVLGVFGTLFAGAAALLAANGNHTLARRMLHLSSLCEVLGASGIIAGIGASGD